MLKRRTLMTSAIAAGATMAAGPMPASVSDRAWNPHNRDLLIRGGLVVTMDLDGRTLNSADVLIQDGRIARIAQRIHSGRHTQVIDAEGRIVAPGNVDSHAHLWESIVAGRSANANPQQHRDLVLGPLPAKLTVEDVYFGTLVGALEGVRNGITTVCNWDLGSLTLDHAKAAVDALADAGVRALHSFSTPQSLQNDPNSPPSEEDFLALVAYMDRYPLLSPHMGTRNPNNRPPEILELVARSMALARQHGWTISMHAGLATSVETPALLQREGLLDDDLIFVNGSAFGPAQMDICAAHGVRIVSEPESEMQQGSPIPTGLMMAAGIRPAVSTGSRAHNPPDIATQTRFMLQSAREKNVTVNDQMLTMRDAFAWGNVNPAQLLHMSDTTGSLSVGKAADIMLVDASADLLPTMDVYADLLQTSSSRVDTVIVAGQIVKRHGELVRHDLSRLRRKLKKLQDQLLSR